MISETPLANLWRKHPWDGQGLGQYPAVALTIVDWSFSTNHFRQRMQNGGSGGSGDGCWVAKARIWWSGKKSQQVDPFKVCWKSSLGMAMTFAPAIQTYMLQVPAGQHTGYKRTTGPLPPMLAEPDQQDSPVGLDGVGSSNFMIQFFAETGWKATQTMNLWITGYDSSEEPKNKRSASTRNGHSSDEASPGAPADVEGKTAKMQRKQSSQDKRASLLIQNAIKCNNPESMEELNTYLQNTEKYKMDGTPVPLSGDITVLGLKPTTIASSGDEDGMSVEVRFPGKTPKKVAKAAGIARNRSGDYHKNTGIGYLNIVMASGEVSLSCTYITGDSEVELQPPVEAGDPAN